MDTALQQRIAANEAIFRQINERIEQGRWPGEDETPLTLRCECARLGCNDMFEIPVDDYEVVRADPRRFLVLPGHEMPEAENIVERTPRYSIVEKFGEAGEFAEAVYPRG